MLRRAPESLLVAIGVILFAMFQALAGCGVRSKEDVMLEYQRTGGIAGLDDRLVIQADGKAILTRKDEHSEFELTSRQISTLKQQLEESEFRSLKGIYKPETQGRDLFEYELTYRGHTVRASDGAIPEALRPVLDSLNAIVQAEHKQQ